MASNDQATTAAGKTTRHTVVVGDLSAFDAVRVALARSGKGHGVRICTMEGLAARLAGGYLQGIRSEDLMKAVAGAIGELPNAALGDIQEIRALPGLRRTVAASLRRAWASNIDLEANAPRHPRIQAMATIEAEVVRRLPGGQFRPGDLADRAVERLGHASAVLGPVGFRYLADLNPVWRNLVARLAGYVPVTWDCGPYPAPEWVQAIPSVALRSSPAAAPELASFACAGPRHEVIEALRWARELIATGQAGPQEIAIAAASTEPFDDAVAALSEEAHLPVHFAHGRPALPTVPGQAAAALADVLLRGVTQERVRRLVGCVRRSAPVLAGLPDGWGTALNGDATLSTPERWRTALAGDAAGPVADVLMPVVELLAKGAAGAEAAGETLLSGQARSLWRRALLHGGGTALDRELAALRVPDGGDPLSCILWTPASALPGCPRPWVWLLGLNAQSWPRRAAEDALLPDHVLKELKPQETSLSERDRRSFHAIHASASKQVARSFSRREPGGRRLAASPLLAGEGVPEPTTLLRTRTPGHAVSVPDRLLARPDEFAATPEAMSATSCWRDWHARELTAHDGLLGRTDHPAIVRALGRVQSASSLTLLLRNPAGFSFRYALGMKPSEPDSDPLALEAREFGELVHDLLEAAAALLGTRGFAGLDGPEAGAAVSAVLPEVASRWESERPVPPDIVWEHTKEMAQSVATSALARAFDVLPGQETFVEVPFGGVQEEAGSGGTAEAAIRPAPWDAGAEVRIPGTGMRIGGYIDRLDISGDRSRARVIDYKTGRRHPGVQLRGGRELQRCLYAYAVQALVSGIGDSIEAGLLYPRSGSAFDTLAEPRDTLAHLAGALAEASGNLRRGLSLPGVAAGLHGKGPKELQAEYEHDDLAFALPAVPGVTLETKKRLAAGMLGGIPEFWREA